MSDSQPFPNRVLRLLDIFRDKFDFENHIFNLTDAEEKEFNSLWKSIVEDLMWSPGTLIYIPDEAERKAAKVFIDMIWKAADADDIFDEMTGGGYSGLLVNIIGDYIDRAKILKPTFISINPENTELYVYFEEAMRSWLFGLNNPALILCCSILESLLKEKLLKISVNHVYDFPDNKTFSSIRPFPIDTLIRNASQTGLLDKQEIDIAFSIKNLRNNAIHKLQNISQQQAYEAIMNTKDLVEKLFRFGDTLSSS